MKNAGRSTHTLAALVILVAFSIGLIAALAAGAGSYRRLNQRSQSAYTQRTGAAYFATKVRQGQRIAIEPIGQGQALCLYQRIGEKEYVTRVYCHDGWLMEQFTPAASQFAPEAGEQVLPMEELSLTLHSGLLELSFSSSSGSRTLWLALPEVAYEE